VPSLSLANRPVFSHGDRTVTITMKGWRFADGQSSMRARSCSSSTCTRPIQPPTAATNAGYGIPDQVKSAAGHDDTVRINFTTSVNPNWFARLLPL